MKTDLFNVFIDETYTKRFKRNYETDKTKLKSIDDCWSEDFSEMKDYKTSNNTGDTCILVVTENQKKLVRQFP